MTISESDICLAVRNTIAQKKEYHSGQTRAAVLIPVISGDKRPELLLTQRTDMVEHHKNQISFPGGVVDSADTSIIDAALRETEEELGISRRDIEVIGLIDEVTTPSRFLVTPVVGILKTLPPLRLNRVEVKDAFTVPLSFFADPNNLRIEYREFKGKEHEVYFYEYGDKTVWGVTAFIIRLFLRCIADAKDRKS